MSDARKPFVETVRIQNFGCARDVTIELTPLHALIGPNDSGKSTVLAATHTACELIRFGQRALEQKAPLDTRGIRSEIAMSWDTTEVVCSQHQNGWKLRAGPRGDEPHADELLERPVAATVEVVNPVRGATLIRWDPDAIRQPCALIPEGGSLVMDERGGGLPAIYDALLSRDRSVFTALDADTRRLFPTVKGIWLPALSSGTKGLGVVLNDGTRVHANEMSEGLLYWLAFAALPYVEPPAVLLIEEPENGLHPSRIADVVKGLRDVSNRIQVIVATHSPLVINELQPHEVSILTRDDKAGTRATRLDRTRHFPQRQKVYAPGELWLSFADGIDEAALVNDDESKRPAG